MQEILVVIPYANQVVERNLLYLQLLCLAVVVPLLLSQLLQLLLLLPMVQVAIIRVTMREMVDLPDHNKPKFLAAIIIMSVVPVVDEKMNVVLPVEL